MLNSTVLFTDLPSLSTIDINAFLYITQSGSPYRIVASEFITGVNLNSLVTTSQLNSLLNFAVTGLIVPAQLNNYSGILINFIITGFITSDQLNNNVNFAVTGINYPHNYIGSGSPNGVVPAVSGSTYVDWFNGTQYNKISGIAANGWVIRKITQPNSFYIKIRNDGLFGRGTLTNPYDGSTFTRFDSIMQSIPTGSNIFIDTGIYPTEGYWFTGGTTVKSNWNISGLGIDKTIIKLVNVVSGQATQNIAISTDTYRGWSDNVTLQNFTVDCNINGQISSTGIVCGGIQLNGNNVMIQNVKIINWGTKTPNYECFALTVGGGQGLALQNNFAGAKILNCTVISGDTSIIPNGGTTLISLGGNFQSYNDISGYLISGLISGCVLDGTGQFSTNGMSVYGNNALACNNNIVNCTNGCYQDSWRNQNVVISNNLFDNVQHGIFYNFPVGQGPASLGTGIFINNIINMGKIATNDNALDAIRFGGSIAYSPYSFTNLLVSGNTIGFANSGSAPDPFYSSAGIIIDYIQSGLIINNIFNNFYSFNDSRFPYSGIFRTGHSQSIIFTGNIVKYPFNSGFNL